MDMNLITIIVLLIAYAILIIVIWEMWDGFTFKKKEVEEDCDCCDDYICDNCITPPSIEDRVLLLESLMYDTIEKVDSLSEYTGQKKHADIDKIHEKIVDMLYDAELKLEDIGLCKLKTKPKKKS